MAVQQSDLDKFFDGVSPEDALELGMDLLVFGKAFVKRSYGEAIRVPPADIYSSTSALESE